LFIFFTVAAFLAGFHATFFLAELVIYLNYFVEILKGEIVEFRSFGSRGVGIDALTQFIF
jgi:hypothetical protein